MQFTMYSRFNPTLAKLGADATADYAANLGFSSVEVLETTSPGHPSVIPDRETAKNIRRIFSEHGLTVACYSVGTCIYRSPEAEESLKYQAEIASELGSPFLHHPRPMAETARKRPYLRRSPRKRRGRRRTDRRIRRAARCHLPV